MPLPKMFLLTSQQDNQNFETELSDIRRHIESCSAVIVIFPNFPRNVTAVLDELSRDVQLTPFEETSDGVLYGYNNQDNICVYSKP